MTERKRTEGALKESEERFRCLADAAMQGVAIMQDGKVVMVNRTASEMFGYDISEAIGKSPLDFVVLEHRGIVRKHISEGYEGPYEITDFLKAMPNPISEEIEKLKTALNENDAANIRLHGIKGICANIAAHRMAEAAYQIKISAKEGRLDLGASLIDQSGDNRCFFRFRRSAFRFQVSKPPDSFWRFRYPDPEQSLFAESFLPDHNNRAPHKSRPD